MIDQKEYITNTVFVIQELYFLIALCDQNIIFLSTYLASSLAIYLIKGITTNSIRKIFIFIYTNRLTI